MYIGTNTGRPANVNPHSWQQRPVLIGQSSRFENMAGIFSWVGAARATSGANSLLAASSKKRLSAMVSIGT